MRVALSTAKERGQFEFTGLCGRAFPSKKENRLTRCGVEDSSLTPSQTEIPHCRRQAALASAYLWWNFETPLLLGVAEV